MVFGKNMDIHGLTENFDLWVINIITIYYDLMDPIIIIISVYNKLCSSFFVVVV